MRRRLLALLTVCLLTAAPCSAGADTGWLPKEHAGYDIKEGKIYYRKGQAGLMLEAPGTEAIARYYSDRGSKIGDPFKDLGPEVDEGAIFLVTLVNRSSGSLTFTPNYVFLRIKTEPAFAMDFTVLLGLLDQKPAAIRNLLINSIFHSPEVVPKGQVVSKFLIFPSIPRKAQSIRLDFDSLFFGDRDARTTFYFVRP